MVVFDKTGPFTRGSPAITGVVAAPGIGESELIALASAVETNSEHSLAKAVVAEADHRGVVRLQAADFEALPGRGAQAVIDGKSIVVGGPGLVAEDKAMVSSRN